MRVIFLDIDGVLNSRKYDAVRRPTDGNIDTTRLALLRQLVERTGARVVLSSSWRKHFDSEAKAMDETGRELKSLFSQSGIPLYGITPESAGHRAEEIAAWCNAHPEVTKFVILDDIKFGWGTLDPFVVKTDYRIGRGLEQIHIEKAAEILLKPE